MARARLSIDLDAINENWRALDARSGPEVETAAVLKADAYGLGITRVAPALAAAGVRTFFVALAEEGAELREVLGLEAEIFVLSGLMPGDAALCREFVLAPCLNSVEQIKEFAAALSGGPCAVQIDSGMNRLGLEPADFIARSPEIAGFAPRLVLSHLACSDLPAHPLNTEQMRVFGAATAALAGTRRSLAATGGILLGGDYHYDLVRPGIGLFGGLPFLEAGPVVSLALPVIQVRDVMPGEVVGYGAHWMAPVPSRVATVAAGYADGLIRAIGNGNVHLYAGKTACPMIGRVSMDLITVDVSALDEVPDHLEILNGHQGIDDLAQAAGTIGYEFLTSLGDRYERAYKGGALQSAT
ncbi:alanine racemase [Rhodobacteraceae bacterium DSL-40]|uniref:alanine racemase n=1 Tax=Amaricoccus sp. B4 TaxID=3368557 RepID=UPI000DADE78F